MKYSGQRYKGEGGETDQGFKDTGNVLFLKLGGGYVLMFYYSSLSNIYLLHTLICLYGILNKNVKFYHNLLK